MSLRARGEGREEASLKLSDIRVYEPQIRARLSNTAHFCEVVVQAAGKGRSEPHRDSVHALHPKHYIKNNYFAEI